MELKLFSALITFWIHAEVEPDFVLVTFRNRHLNRVSQTASQFRGQGRDGGSIEPEGGTFDDRVYEMNFVQHNENELA
jgi:hypothetical protein